MSIVNLASGGLDSTLVSVLTREEGLHLHPLFLDYGQRAARAEWAACRRVHADLGLPNPTRMDISGFGSIVRSGLTSTTLDIHADAFTPTRNLLFLVVAGAFACEVGADSVAIGLLAERLQSISGSACRFRTQGRDSNRLRLEPANPDRHAIDGVQQGRRHPTRAGQGDRRDLFVPRRRLSTLRPLHRLP